MNELKLIIAVGFGGMIGAMLRYGVSLLVTENVSSFPWATLFVNIVGAFLLAYLLSRALTHLNISDVLLTALSTGVLGAFTTFSTIIVDSVSLWMKSPLMTIIYMGVSFFGGLLLSMVGFFAGQRKWKR